MSDNSATELVAVVPPGGLVGSGSDPAAVEPAGPRRTQRWMARTQRGMVSAEWTVGIIAAIAIAGVLLAVVTSGPVESLLLKVVLSIIKTFTRNL